MAKNSKHCSFCGRPESQIGFLILGVDNSHICDECAVQAAEIVKDTKKQVAAPKLDKAKTPKPKEIKSFLDQYVIGQDSAKKTRKITGKKALSFKNTLHHHCKSTETAVVRAVQEFAVSLTFVHA